MKMKTKSKILVITLALAATTAAVLAQDRAGNPPRGHRPPPPVIVALDANHDGVIDADEIANASAALKTLDKNGDGKLTQDELRPPGSPPDDMNGGQPPQGNE
jgi:hypothetical protein